MKTLVYLLVLALMTVISSCSDSEPVSATGHQDQDYFLSDLQSFHDLTDGVSRSQAVRVMTRNIYIGTDVDVVLSASDPDSIPILAAQAFQTLLATNFPERAISLAREIALTKPDLIGLQEVSLLRIQDPGDAVTGGTVPAEEVLMDYLDILMLTFDAMGLPYEVAAMVENADVEMPMITGTDPLSFADIRVTDYDVILVRKGIEFSDVTARNYQVNLIIPGLGMEIVRGYVGIDATVNGTTYRFVNTHLEPFVQQVKVAQAQELLASLKEETLPIIMLGDFNSQAPTGEVYNVIVDAGYQDAWLENTWSDDADGNTYGHDADLMNETVNFYERIDHIYIRHGDDPVRLWTHAIVVGDEQFNRTESGLWPSDHGGVAARLRINPNIANNHKRKLYQESFTGR